MALEDALAALTKAITENTARLDKMLGGATAPAGTKPAGTKPAGTKPAGKPKMDAKAWGEAATSYLKSEGGSDEAKGKIKRIAQQFDVERWTLIPEENWEEAKGYLDQYAAGEDPFGEGEEESPI